MKALLYKVILLIIFSVCSFTLRAQSDSLKIDSLKKELLTEKEDTNKVNTLLELSYIQRFMNDDYENSLLNAKMALSLSEKIFFKKGKGDGFRYTGAAYESLYNYPEALKNFYAALKIYKEIEDKKSMAECFQCIGYTYQTQGNDSEALNNYNTSLKVREDIADKSGIGQTYNAMSQIYSRQGKFDEALEKQFSALKLFREPGMPSWGLPLTYFEIANSYENQGDDFILKGDRKSAHTKYFESAKNVLLSLKGYEDNGWQSSVAECYSVLANLSIKLNEFKKAGQYVQKALQLSKEYNNKGLISASYLVLYALDSSKGMYKHALQDYKLYILYNDSISNAETSKKFVQTQMQHEFADKEAIAKAAQDKKDADARRIKNQQYYAIAALGIIVLAVIIVALIQFRNNKQKQKANNLITQQKQQVETTLIELKSTQAQLIQSEKMASLGELTAGIAHEIQNPLNFVNNFSEVNKELVEELQSELKSGNTGEALAISNDIKANEEKINHHGKRADAIVKGMLQHSRQTSGTKEPTDINALCDEYLRLSYHGLRAKDKSFNATLNTDFDESIGKINIVPQDMGRVLLNLFNNAFYACAERSRSATSEKQKAESLKQSGLTTFEKLSTLYEPLVSVQTKKINDKVEIIVSDNGNGIPQNIIDKIFQPFFTTKPTGEGTGLGLSLAYDIITKQHNGTIKVESKVDEGNPDGFGKDNGTTFIIQLPNI